MLANLDDVLKPAHVLRGLSPFVPQESLTRFRMRVLRGFAGGFCGFVQGRMTRAARCLTSPPPTAPTLSSAPPSHHL